MNYKILWSYSANKSYFDELEFIFKKWNQNQVIIFEYLVEIALNRLKINPLLVIYAKQFQLYFLVISKQTKLYYRINIKTQSIELILFWNNLKNPADLIKLL